MKTNLNTMQHNIIVMLKCTHCLYNFFRITKPNIFIDTVWIIYSNNNSMFIARHNIVSIIIEVSHL